jgi:hypothetical protein
MGLASWWNNLITGAAAQPLVAADLTHTSLYEATGVSLGYDPDAALTVAQGGGSAYRQLGGRTKRDLSPTTNDQVRERVWELYEINPVGKRVPELIRDYVLGEGVTIETADDAPPALAPILDGFWHYPRNNLDLFIHERILGLNLFGEAVWTVATNPTSGAVELGYVDPGSVAAILTDRHNPLLVTDVVLAGAAGEQPRLKAVAVDLDPFSATYGRLVGARDGETYTDGGAEKPYLGSAFVFRINTVPGATRGRSDLLCLADWIDALDQILFNEVDRQLLIKSFVWDVTLTGMTEGQIQEWLAKNPSPKPGSVRAHNEKIAWDVVAPSLNTADTSASVDLMRDAIAAGAGIPKTWLSGTDDVNRATAQELGEPAFKRLTLRQKIVRAMLTDVLAYVADQAEMAGKLPKRPPEPATGIPAPWPFTVTLPELRGKDMKVSADTLASAATALAALTTAGLSDMASAQRAVVVLYGQMGVEVDLEDMQAAIGAEAAEREAKALAMFDRQAAADQADEDETDDERVPVGLNGRSAAD